MKKDWEKYLKIGSMVFLLFLAVYYWEAFTGVIGIAWKAAKPLITGAFMAYVLNILMSFYETHYFPKSSKSAVIKSRRPVCLVASFLTLILIMIFVIRMVVPELISCISLLFTGVPEVLEMVVARLSKLEFVSEDIIAALEGIDWREMLAKAFNVLTSGIGNTVNFALGAVTSVVSSVMNIVIGAIFAIYLLAGREKLLAQSNRLMKTYLRPAWNDRIHYILSVMNESFHKFIVGQCTEAVILGTLCMIGMLIFGFPYAVMTGVVIGVTALIPVAGAYIGGMVGFLLILTSGSFTKAILFLVYLVVLQQLEDNLIYPRVVGSSIGLPGIWVLAVITIGGGVCGIPGMLLGVPLAATVYRLLKNDVKRKETAV